jgi:hypothetical protein
VPDNDVQIGFGADTSDLKAGVRAASGLINGLASDLASLTRTLSGVGGSMQGALKPPNASGFADSFGQIADAAKQMENAVASAVVGGNQAIEASNKQASDRMRAAWDKSIGSIVSDFGQGLLKVSQGSETWQKFTNRLLGQIETRAVATAAKVVSHWIYGEMAKTSSTAAGVAARGAAEKAGAAQSRMLSFSTAEKQIFNDALKAASAAYSAMAGIPIIGPALGAGAAAVTFAAVEAYGQMASAAGGFDIPSGINPLTQLHQNEMVLPASLANPLRGLLGDYAGPGPSAAGGAGDSGETHLHLHMGAGADGPSLQRWFDQHGDKIARSLSSQTRRGAKFT